MYKIFVLKHTHLVSSTTLSFHSRTAVCKVCPSNSTTTYNLPAKTKKSHHKNPRKNTRKKSKRTSSNTQQEVYSAKHCCNTLQHTATHCNTLQHTATHCNTLQHTDKHCCNTEAHCNTLQHIATHYNTLHHTAATQQELYSVKTGWPTYTTCQQKHSRATKHTTAGKSNTNTAGKPHTTKQNN